MHWGLSGKLIALFYSKEQLVKILRYILPASLALYSSLTSSQPADEKFSDLISRLESLVPSDMNTLQNRIDLENGFTVESSRTKELGENLQPTSQNFDYVGIISKETFKVAIEKGREQSGGGGVGVFHRESGTPMLSFGDNNDDGLIDNITFNVLDESGEYVMSTVDYDADGQWDIRTYYKAQKNEVWYDSSWYVVENRNNKPGIEVNGKYLELTRANGRILVAPQ